MAATIASGTDRSSEPHRGNDWLAPVLAGASLLLFGALQLYAFDYYEGDENIYFYLATRAADGLVPYRDFFHGHPPLHLLPGVLAFFTLGGFELVAVRLLSMGAAGVAGIALYRVGRRLGPAEAGLCCALYLLSYHTLVLSGHFLGASLCAMWVAIALERACAKRPGSAGAAFAGATLTLLNAAPAGVGLGIALLIHDRSAALRYAAIGLLVFALSNGLALLAFGPDFVGQVYLYHTGKESVTMAGIAAFRSFAYTDGFVVYGALVGVTAVVLARFGDSANGDAAPSPRSPIPLPLTAGALAGAASILFLTLLPRLFTHYFLVLLVCLTPLAAHGFAEIFRRARMAWVQRSSSRATEAAVLTLIASLVLLPFIAGRAADGLASSYRWRGSGVGVVDGFVRTLFWRDEKRKDTFHGPITRHLWITSRPFEGAHELAREVAARSRPDETLFGDSTSAPLVALLADRRITGEEADTNAQRFGASGVPIEELIQRLDADPPALILGRKGFEIFSFRAFRTWVSHHYEIVFELDEPNVGARYQLWARRDPAGSQP